MEKIYRVIEIPPDPPFSKGGECSAVFQRGGEMFCCFRKLSGMQPKIASEYLPPLPKGGRGGFNDRPKETPNISPFRKGQNISIFCKGQNISPFRKGGRGNFHSREVMVETEVVMEKIYRVIEIPPDPPFSKGGNVLPFFKGGGECSAVFGNLPACSRR
jgi:hypothetical protein